MTACNPTLTLFFTYDVSLKTWAETGLLQREIRLYQALLRKGVNVQFLTYGDASDRQWEDGLGGIRLLPVYERLNRPKNRLLRLLQSVLVPWVFRKELRQSDLFKTNQIWGGWVAVLARWGMRKPLLARGGFEAYRNALQDRKRPLWLALLRWTSWLTYRQADHVWLNTPEISKFVQETFRIPENKITVWPNWIDTQSFAPPVSGAVQTEQCLLFVGRFSAEKNISLFLQALEGTDYALDIIGVGELRGDLEREARQRGIDARFLGRVPNDQLPGIYNAHPVYVLCSRYEGNPKTLLEAMACGCAVVGTDVPGIREVIRHEESGMLVEQTPEALRSAILRLFADEALRRRLSTNARQQILQQNSFEAALLQELSMYQQLTATT